MSRLKTRLLAASALCAGLSAPPAMAQEFSNFLVFGDSLVDSGQFPDPGRFLGLAPGLPEDARLRFTNRVTGGQYGNVYSQLLSTRLGFGPSNPSQPLNIDAATQAALGVADTAIASTPPGFNYAVGGQIAEEVRSSITGETITRGPTAGQAGAITRAGVIGLPNFLDVQNDAFLQGANAGAAQGALALISAGGNDIRRVANVNFDQTGITGVTFEADPTAVRNEMQAAAADTAAGAQALLDAGVDTVIVGNLPRLGDIPETAFDTAALQQAIAAGAPIDPALVAALNANPALFVDARNGASDAYNAALNANLNGVSGNVVQVDLQSLFEAVIANPAVFGLDGTVNQAQTCFNGGEATLIACAEDPTNGFNAGRNPLALLFNDGIHPTIAGHAITADFIANQLEAPQQIGLAPHLPLAALRQGSDALEDAARAGIYAQPGSLRPFVTLGAAAADYEPQGVQAAGDGQILSATGGLSYTLMEGVTAGVGGGYQYLTAEASDVEFDGNMLFGGAFVGADMGPIFGGGQFLAGRVDYSDISRSSRLGAGSFRNDGSPEGTVIGGAAKIGAKLFNSDAFSAGPIARIDYFHADLDGYTESGDAFSALRYDAIEASSSRGALGAFIQANTVMGHTPLNFIGELVFEHEFMDGDGDAITAAAASLGGAGFVTQGRGPADAGVRLGFAINADLGFGEAGLGYTFRGGDDIVHGARLQVAVPF